MVSIQLHDLKVMANFSDRETFIPYRRSDLIRMLLAENLLDAQAADPFLRFSEILSAYYHFRFQRSLEQLKDLFAPFDPDSDTGVWQPSKPAELTDMEEKLVRVFIAVLESANYSRLTEEDLRGAFNAESLIPLNTHVDFEDYEKGRILFFVRGTRPVTVPFRRWFRKTERRFDAYERVVLLLKFKPVEHFIRKKKKPEELNFSPGKTYVYLYKNIPRFDVDILFPNVDVSMNWKDLLKFGLPAAGALVPILIKTLPNILLIIGIILFFTVGPSAAARWGATDETMNNLFPILTAILSAGFMLGSYAFKQYMNYKNKRLKFLKNVTDTLFFKNLDCNAGVFHRIVDEAEEEETKEILLVYYFLLTHNHLTKSEVDNRIEEWMEVRFGKKLDFDVEKTFRNLQGLTATVNGRQESLLTVRPDGTCDVLEIDRANALVDYLWDNVFSFNISSSRS